MKIKTSGHPLNIHKLTQLRQGKSLVSSRDYGRLMRELGMLMAYEATWDLKLKKRDAVPKTDIRAGWEIPEELEPAIVPIVRSGLVMADGMREIIPSPYMGHIGIYSDQILGEAYEFMVTMPEDAGDRLYLVVDPFIDTGTTACAAIRIIRQFGIPSERIRFVTLVISRRGLARVKADAEARQVAFYCVRADGDTDDEDWFKDFDDMNKRLYRTAVKQRVPHD